MVCGCVLHPYIRYVKHSHYEIQQYKCNKQSYLLKCTFEKRRFSAVHSDGIIYPDFSHSAPGGALDDTDAQ